MVRTSDSRIQGTPAIRLHSVGAIGMHFVVPLGLVLSVGPGYLVIGAAATNTLAIQMNIAVEVVFVKGGGNEDAGGFESA